MLLLLSFFLSATEKTMAVARFFFFFCGREIKLILNSERERELPQVSHLGFALEKRSCTQLEFARLMFDFVCVFGCCCLMTVVCMAGVCEL
jgi:hypothetical protein